MFNLKSILTTLIIAGVFALHPSLNKGNNPITNLQHFVYGNSLNISTNKTINRNLLEVKWLCETNDTPCSDLDIFRNGAQTNEIPSVKGNQKLVLFYAGEKIGEIHQKKICQKSSTRLQYLSFGRQ
jgi:hypothetical protein